MQVLRSILDFNIWRESVASGLKVGFVPTMGALHAGHASLLERARRENDFVVLSIFVNPTQFNQASDFEKYPHTWAADLEVARTSGVDVIFYPENPEVIYPEGYRFEVREKEFSKSLCGEFRPGHFEGVLTVVMKLLNLVRADSAYFGEKDFQQFSLIRDMARDFFMRTKIVPCSTAREQSGLAMSSRNMRLSDSGKERAAAIYETLLSASSPSEGREKLQRLGFEVEYFEEKNGRRFVAAWLEGVRLIDNVDYAHTTLNRRNPQRTSEAIL